MEFSIYNYYFLILIPILLFAIIFIGRKITTSKFKKKFSIILRSFIVVLLILALSNIYFFSKSDKTTTIFLVDKSDSIQDINASSQFIENSLKYKTNNDIVGVVSFAKESNIEYSPQQNIKFSGFQIIIDKTNTNIEKALMLANSLIDSTTSKRIVILTDGLENQGKALEQAKILKENGVNIDVVDIQTKTEKEVQLTNIKVPEHSNIDALTDITVTANSQSKGAAQIYLYKNNDLLSVNNVTLNKGENNFVFTDKNTVGGSIIYKAEIRKEEDVFQENNIVYGYNYIEDLPHILLLEQENSGENIANLIKDNVILDRRNGLNAPTTISELSQYDTIIIGNTSIENINDKFQKILGNYVRDIGGGLIVLGGENSFGMGNYKGTELEDLLPVESDIKDDKELPDLTMVLTIDRSGSMQGSDYGIEKLQMAKEACQRALINLTDNDYLGVLAFDDMNLWQIPITNVGSNKNEMEKAIGNISAGGGTSILPALTASVQEIMKEKTALKHIILLTDGQAETTGYGGIVRLMESEKITLTTVAVGSDADKVFMKSLAEMANGKYFYSDAFSDLPNIFAKEVQRVSKKYIQDEPFDPVINDYNQLLKNVDALPTIGGYIKTTAKDRSDVVLKTTTNNEPLLASIQMGLGMVVAYTSDINKEWSDNLLQTSQGKTLVNNMLSFTLKQDFNKNYNMETKTENDLTKVTIKVPDYNDETTIKGTIIGDDNTVIPLTFNAVSPSIYEAKVEDLKTGMYIANVNINNNENNEILQKGISIPYSSEYDINTFAFKESYINTFLSTTQGTLIKKPEEVFYKIKANAYNGKNISNLLIFLALLLLLFDILFRRFNYISGNIENIFLVISSKFSYNRYINYKNNKKLNEKLQFEHKKVDNNNVVKNRDKKKTKTTELTEEKTTTSNVLLAKKKKRKGE